MFLLPLLLAAAAIAHAAKLDRALKALQSPAPTFSRDADAAAKVAQQLGATLTDSITALGAQLSAELRAARPEIFDEAARQKEKNDEEKSAELPTSAPVLCRLADGVELEGGVAVVGGVAHRVGARGRDVSFKIAVDLLDALAASELFASCRSTPFTTGGARRRLERRGTGGRGVVSQGDKASRADKARRLFGVTGKGVKVGVVADSFGCFGSVQADIESGELPVDTVILEDDVDCQFVIDEGRAMAQLVHDLAPDASIVFCSAGNGFFQFADCFGKLADAGCHVIVEDITFGIQTAFTDDVVASAVDAVAQRGVPVFTSAGNTARTSWEGPFAAQRNDDDDFFIGDESEFIDLALTFVDEFGRASDLIPELNRWYVHSWDQAGDDGAARAQPLFTCLLPRFYAGSTTVFKTLEFDETWADGQGTLVQDNIVDGARTTLLLWCMVILNAADGTPFGVVCSTNNLEDPQVSINAVLNGGPFITFDLLLSPVGFSQPGRMRTFDFGGRDPLELDRVLRSDFTGLFSRSGTIIGHHNAAGAITVGAADYRQTPAFDPSLKTAILEPFSSAGGVPILFDRDSRLAVPIVRQKPDLVCVDGTDTSFFGGDSDDNGFPNFFGTSAAAPHAAAIAALMLELQPTLTPEQIRAALTGSAIDMDVLGFDFNTGHGFCDAVGALQLAANAKPSTAAEETGDETLTFCTRGGQLTAGACDEGKKRAVIVTATGVQRVVLQSRVNFVRLSPPARDGCGIVQTLTVDGKAVSMSDRATSEARGTIDGHALVDLEDGTHVAALSFVVHHCSGVKFALTDPAIVATKVIDVAAVELDRKIKLVLEGGSSSSSD